MGTTSSYQLKHRWAAYEPELQITFLASTWTQTAADLAMSKLYPFLVREAELMFRRLHCPDPGNKASDAVHNWWIVSIAVRASRRVHPPVFPYACAMLRYIVLGMERAEKRFSFSIEGTEPAAAEYDPAPNLNREQSQEKVWDAILRLPERYRLILILRLEWELPSNKIAAYLDIPPATVQTWIFRAHAILRDSLADFSPESETSPVGCAKDKLAPIAR